MKWQAIAMLVAGIAPSGWVSAQEGAPTAEVVRKAADEFSQARHAYLSQEYVIAAEHFEAADALVPTTNALHGALTSRYQAGQSARAATLAALALERYPENTELRELATTVLEQTRQKVYRLVVHCDIPCDLVVGTALVHGSAASERTIYLDPGMSTLRASWPGYPALSRQIDALAGEEGEVFFVRPELARSRAARASTGPDTSSLASGRGKLLPETIMRAAPARPGGSPASFPPRSWSPLVFWAGVGTTGALALATTWSGIDTINNPGQDTVRQKCQGLGTACPEYQDGLARQYRTNMLGVATGVVGIGTAVIGLLFTDWRRREPAGSTSLGAAKTLEPELGLESGLAASARGRF